MPRQARLDTPGALHHVMIRGINKEKIFVDDQDRNQFLQKLAETTLDSKATIYAFALMNNHIHMLIRSGEEGLSALMRRILTWYAIYFNHRHKRTGHLFENRYKSILCEEEQYLLSLVRYIHLNPIRAGIIKDVNSLERYPWSSHQIFVGKNNYPWIDKDFVLGQFGKTWNRAVQAYRRFIQEGSSMGPMPELVGGGLVRSLGGWSQVVSMRRKETQKGDERILGSSQFVQKVLAETKERHLRQLKVKVSKQTIEEVIKEECRKRRIHQEELKNGGRRTIVSSVRSSIAYRAVTELGLPAAEAARYLGVTTSTVTRAVERIEKRK